MQKTADACMKAKDMSAMAKDGKKHEGKPKSMPKGSMKTP